MSLPIRYFTILIFACAFTLVFLLLRISPISSNDGSQMALTQALGSERLPIINSFIQLTNRNDSAFRQGNYFSDRPPIYSALAAPFVAVGSLLASSDSELSYTLATIPAALAVVSIALILFKVLTSTGLSPNQSIATLALVAFSPLGKYIFVALPHGLSAAIILYVVTRPYSEARQSRDKLSGITTPFWDGFLTGLLPFIRYENTFLIPLFIVFAWKGLRRFSFFTLVAGVACGALPGLLYHHQLFGSPFTTPGPFTLPDRNIWGEAPSTGRVGGAFAAVDFFPNIPGNPAAIFDLLIGSPWSLTGGLFFLAPILAPLTFGLIQLARSGSGIHLRAILTASLLLLVVSSQANFSGGLMRDGRYLLPCIPLIALGASWRPLWGAISVRFMTILGAIGLGHAMGRYLTASGTDMATVQGRLALNFQMVSTSPQQTILFLIVGCLTALTLQRFCSSRLRNLVIVYVVGSLLMFTMTIAFMPRQIASTFAHADALATVVSQRIGWITPLPQSSTGVNERRFLVQDSAYFSFDRPPGTPPAFINLTTGEYLPVEVHADLSKDNLSRIYAELINSKAPHPSIYTDETAYLVFNPLRVDVVIACATTRLGLPPQD